MCRKRGRGDREGCVGRGGGCGEGKEGVREWVRVKEPTKVKILELTWGERMVWVKSVSLDTVLGTPLPPLG